MKKPSTIQIITTILVLFTLPVLAQKKDFTLDNIFVNREIRTKSISSINWMSDGKYYTGKRESRIIKFNTSTGEEIETLFDGEEQDLSFRGYSLSSDESKLLIRTKVKSIYRRSFTAEYYVYDIVSKELKELSKNGKQQYATFSPDGNKVAFVRENNLYYTDLESGKEVQVTKDGERNKIINGTTDWVYEEEFGFVKAFHWSPEGDKLAYMRFDESKVPEYNMQVWDSLYPTDYRYKYPKAGEPNSEIQIKIFHLEDENTVDANLGGFKDVYYPRVQWTANNDLLSVIRLNRLQQQFEIVHIGANSGMAQIQLLERNSKYFDINFCDDLTYLKNGKGFIYSSEQSRYKHFWYYDYNSKKLSPITKGEWEADNLISIDEKGKVLYYTSTEDSHLERHLYKIGLNGKGKQKLSKGEGWHSINMSRDSKYYIDIWSKPEMPTQYTLYESNGKQIKVLEDNKEASEKMKEFNWLPKEYTTLTIKDSVELHGYIIKPANFDPSKKYPLMMFLYGGPGSQQVTKRYDGYSRDLYHRMLAQKGYMIACFDNQGTGGRGSKFKKITYKQLGKIETEDQIEVAKALGARDYVDESRIGIWGWSYGGFMSSSCLFKGNDVFSLAIAVAPVTNWRYYDNIYTERYMQRPQDNAEGYDDNSPINFADQLKGDFLLIHGTSDDNVHFQNAVELTKELIKEGKPFDSFYYPNSNHGIYTGGATLHIYTKMANFILENL